MKPAKIAAGIVILAAIIFCIFFLRHIGLRSSIVVGIFVGALLAAPVYYVVDNLTDEYVGEE